MSQDASALLSAHDLRPTQARRHLLELLYSDNSHYTPEEMLSALDARGRTLSAATLYQNLRQLTEKGLLTKLTGPSGVTRYDANTTSHDHMICKRCGKMVDVVTSGPISELRPSPLSHESADLTAWELEHRQIEYQGVCPACQD